MRVYELGFDHTGLYFKLGDLWTEFKITARKIENPLLQGDDQ